MDAPSRTRSSAVLVAGALFPAHLASACSSSSSGTGYLAQSVAMADLDGDGRFDACSAEV